jgi:hypothetical protein
LETLDKTAEQVAVARIYCELLNDLTPGGSASASRHEGIGEYLFVLKATAIGKGSDTVCVLYQIDGGET